MQWSTCVIHLLRTFFYCRPYHHVPLLEKDQYERIWRLRLILYHYNLHLWYMVIYIGVIGVLLEVLSRWHKRNIWFLHFKIFPFSSGDMAKISFQISKMKIFNFFISNFKIDFFSKFSFQFLWYSSIFSFLSGGMVKFFQISKVIFSNFFYFPLVVWPFFFKIQKQKFLIQISKMIFFHSKFFVA
jgi:hypothetical protein